MRQSCIALSLLGVASLLAGCGGQGGADSPESSAKGKAAMGGVAVIDLDEVAKRLGRDAEMAGSITTRESDLNEQLGALQTSLRRDYDAEEQRLADAPIDEQTTKLQQLQNDHQTRLATAQRQAQQDFAVYKARVVNGFRDEMKPVARRIAAEKGLGVVVTKNETVLFTYDDAVDITDEVAAELLSRHGSSSTRDGKSPPSEETPPPPSRTARKPN